MKLALVGIKRQGWIPAEWQIINFWKCERQGVMITPGYPGANYSQRDPIVLQLSPSFRQALNTSHRARGSSSVWILSWQFNKACRLGG